MQGGGDRTGYRRPYLRDNANTVSPRACARNARVGARISRIHLFVSPRACARNARESHTAAQRWPVTRIEPLGGIPTRGTVSRVCGLVWGKYHMLRLCHFLALDVDERVEFSEFSLILEVAPKEQEQRHDRHEGRQDKRPMSR